MAMSETHTDDPATSEPTVPSAESAASPTADLAARLHELEQLVADAKAVPLSASIMLNRADIDRVLVALRESVPGEVRQARWVMQEQEEILARARSEARRLLHNAQDERHRLVARTEVVQAANREADRIVEDAHERARQIRHEAEDYVDAKLANFEVVLQKTLGAVERGREKLRGRLDAAELAEAELLGDDEPAEA